MKVISRNFMNAEFPTYENKSNSKWLCLSMQRSIMRIQIQYITNTLCRLCKNLAVTYIKPFTVASNFNRIKWIFSSPGQSLGRVFVLPLASTSALAKCSSFYVKCFFT